MLLEATFRRCVQCGHNVVGTVGNNVQVGCADAKGSNILSLSRIYPGFHVVYAKFWLSQIHNRKHFSLCVCVRARASRFKILCVQRHLFQTLALMNRYLS